MQNEISPLQKYKRQPKLYIDLPSKGVWYPKNTLEKTEGLEVYSMSANDEINIKTPDALFTGIAIKKLIESCIPSIKDAWYVPTVDMDYILAAIRLATYGDTIELSTTCKDCENQDTYALPLQGILDHFQNAKPTYETRVDNFLFKLRPLCYKEVTDFQIEAFQVRRIIQQKLAVMEDTLERDEQLRSQYERLREKQKETVCKSILEIVTPEGESETHQEFIRDFVINGDKIYFNALEELYENNQAALKLPTTLVNCSACNTEQTVQTDLDYSNFFVQG